VIRRFNQPIGFIRLAEIIRGHSHLFVKLKSETISESLEFGKTCVYVAMT